MLSHLSRLGLQVNWEKSILSPTQRISFFGMELDSVNLTARLSIERAQSMLSCLESFQRKRAVPLKHFQRLLGHMASAAAVTPLGLLHMRPLQRWLHNRVPRWAWRHDTSRGLSHPVLLPHLQPMVRSCFSSGRSSPSASVQACCCINRCLYHRLGCHVQRARRFKMLLHERHVLVRTDNTATVAYINLQGGLRSRRMSQLAHHLLLWSQKHLRSLRTVHVPGELNRAADELSRQPALPGEWRLPPEEVQLIWRRFGDAQVDLFATSQNVIYFVMLI